MSFVEPDSCLVCKDRFSCSLKKSVDQYTWEALSKSDCQSSFIEKFLDGLYHAIGENCIGFTYHVFEENKEDVR